MSSQVQPKFDDIIGDIVSGTTYLMQVYKDRNVIKHRAKVQITRKKLNDLTTSFKVLIDEAATARKQSQDRYFSTSKAAREKMDGLSHNISACNKLSAEMHGADLGVHMMDRVDHATLTRFTMDQNFGFDNVYTEMAGWLQQASRDHEVAVKNCARMRGEIDVLVEETKKADEKFQQRNGEWMMLVQKSEILEPWMRYAVENVESVLKKADADKRKRESGVMFELEALESPSTPSTSSTPSAASTWDLERNYLPYRAAKSGKYIPYRALESPKTPSTSASSTTSSPILKYLPYRPLSIEIPKIGKITSPKDKQFDRLSDPSYNKQLTSVDAAHDLIAGQQKCEWAADPIKKLASERIQHGCMMSSEHSMWF